LFYGLATVVYKDILKRGDFGIQNARPSIEAVYRIRNFKYIRFTD